MCGARMRKSSGKTRLPVCAEPVNVRLCREEDLPQVEEVLRISPEAAGWLAGSLRESFEREGPLFQVACQGPEIVGFICGRRVADEAEILDLAVRPERRRQGVGQKLVEAFLETGASEKWSRVHLEVRESNAAAIALYSRAGFQQTGRRPGYYQAPSEAALLMTHVLD
jgi:[ribosomal protein S18]-alanine N-acetyltransferase